MNKKLSEHYNSDFYSTHSDGSVRSAEAILPLLYKFYQPLSVIDIGCGNGSWLKAAGALGSNKLKGMDGCWIDRDALVSNGIDFTPVDFENKIDIRERYDLCISVEVAEHISEDNAKRFISTLCNASDVVLFSSAIKGQGGTNHINEQWQSYWAGLFGSEGYKCFDIFRSTLWDNEAVEWWYRQNIFLFMKPGTGLIDMTRFKISALPITDIVHPQNYAKKIKNNQDLSKLIEYPSLRFCMKCIKRFILNKFR
ncbi:MAG: class I SAM-dependent methyltransferase [Nitrospirae bacterium]|nr:class I SAM-dependent methyltransferase [Nitrospirota bacterium]